MRVLLSNRAPILVDRLSAVFHFPKLTSAFKSSLFIVLFIRFAIVFVIIGAFLLIAQWTKTALMFPAYDLFCSVRRMGCK